MLTVYLTSVANSTASPDLDDLLDRVRQGDRDALQRLYEAISKEVYGYALSVVQNEHDAQDVLQDSFLSIVHGAKTYRPQGKAKAWIYTIVHNRCVQVLRTRQKTTPLSEDEEQGWIDDRIPCTTEDRLALSACMNRLSDEERQIVVLHAVSGFRHREIAQILHLALPTVLSKYSRALKKLRVILEKGDTA